MAHIFVDVELRTVFEAVRHGPIRVLLKPLAYVDGDRHRTASVAGVCPLEDGDMVVDETLCPRVPFGIRDAGPVLGSDVKVIVLRAAGWWEIGIADAPFTADG